MHKAAAMGVDEERRARRRVRQIEPARHLAVRPRQTKILLTLKRHRPFAEKDADPILGGADLDERRFGAVGDDQTAALQQRLRRRNFGVDPRCRLAHPAISVSLSQPILNSAAKE